jgi:hypothetical protein
VTASKHFERFAKAVFDWKTIVSPAATAELSQISPWHAGFTNNTNGYLRHYGDNIVGNVSNKFLGTFALPSLFHQDERYTPRNPGASWRDRVVHVVMHSIFTASANHAGGTVFNASAIPATAISALMSNLYEPKQQRTVSATASRFGLGMLIFIAGDAFTEFRPQLKRRVQEMVTLGLVKQPPQTLDYSKLTDAQQSYLKSQGQKWGALNFSQQIEYVGVTHALNNWCQHEPDCSEQWKDHPQPGLGEVGPLIKPGITGAVEGAESVDQFNLTVTWLPCAEEHIRTAFGWSTHDSVLHKGMHGYNQGADFDPFLGIVALFDNDKTSMKGQIHIDFREGIDHYEPQNGSVQANYPVYCDWYGAMEGYSEACPAYPKGRSISKTANLLATSQLPPKPANPPPLPVPVNAPLRTVAEAFLTAWYVNRDYDGLKKYIASDNEFAFLPIHTQTQLAPGKRWTQIFQHAFKSAGGHILTLTDAINYSKPAPEARLASLKFLNENSSHQFSDPFAVIDPASAPPGTYFPPLNLPPERRGRFSPRAQFLDHLQRDYPGRLQLVVYATKSPDLSQEGVVLYWVFEDSQWRLAGFQSTD